MIRKAEKFPKGKKFKLYRVVVRKVITVDLAIVLATSLTSCGKYNYMDDYSSSETYIEDNSTNDELTEEDLYFLSNEDAVFYIKPGEDEYVELKSKSDKFEISEYTANNIINYINGIEVEYPYEEIYSMEEVYATSKDKQKSETHLRDVTNGTEILDSEILYQTVLKNNKTFKNSDEYNALYGKLSRSLIKKVCNQLVESLNREFDNNENLDKNEVFCNLADLKIFGYLIGGANASYSENNVLIVNESGIERYQALNPDIDAFRQIISHEAEHMIQSACIDNEKNNEVSLGICQRYEDSDINPLYWQWLLEASAENRMAETLGEQPNTYLSQIGYFDSLKLITMLNKDITVDDITNVTYDKKLSDFFKAFNAISNEEKIELMKAMYSIEIMQSRPSDFYFKYEELTGIDLFSDTESEEKLRLSLRISILETFTKQFYKSMATLLTNNKISLETLYYLINVYESDVFIHLFYNEEQRIINGGVEFFDFYTNIQNKFFETIFPYTNYSYDEIVNNFENYSMNVIYNGEKIKNYSIDFLDNDEKEFIQNKEKQNYQTGIPTIRSMVDYCKNNGYKK